MWKQAFVLFLFFVSSSRTSASFSFKIASVYPANISDSTQEIQVNLELQDLPSPSFFRVAFQKQSGDPYFGYIKNHLGNWVQIKSLNSDCHDYYHLDDTSTTSANILLKVGESTFEPGDYLIKAHRFTSTSCTSTEATNSQPITLDSPQVTLTPTLAVLAPTTTKTPLPTKTSPPPSVPTPFVTKLVPTLITPSTSYLPTSTPLVLSIQTLSSTTTPIPISTTTGLPSKTPHWPQIVLIVSGSICLIASVASFLFRHH